MIEVDEPDLVAAGRAVGLFDLDVDAVDEQLVEAAVVLDQRRVLHAQHGGYGLIDRRRRKARVDAFESGGEAPSQDDFGEVVALGAQLLRIDVGSVDGLPADVGEPAESGFFDD